MSPLLIFGAIVSLSRLAAGANHALIIDTSRLWTNYRHSSNVLSIYSVVRQLGIPDSRISLMVPGDIPCNPVNAEAGQVFHTRGRNLFTQVDSDYKGEEITRDTISRLITNRHLPWTPRHRRLASAPDSKVLIFMTGHSGVGFAKIQDLDEFHAADIADILKEMEIVHRYDKLLWVGDTCRAASLHNEFYSDNVIAVGSSQDRQSSYSRHGDRGLGVSVVDRFSYHTEELLSKAFLSKRNFSMSIEEFSSKFTHAMLMSDVSLRTDALSGTETLADFLTDTDEVIDFHLAVGSWKNAEPASRLIEDRSVQLDLRMRHKVKNSFSVEPKKLHEKRWSWNWISGGLLSIVFITSVFIS